MTKEFIPYEEALALKELGFNEPCFATYDEDKNFELQDFFQTYETFPSHIIAEPTFSQAFRWFREKHELYISFTRYRSISVKNNPVIFPFLYDVDIIDDKKGIIITVGEFNVYEKAELACLKKLIEIVKKNL